METKKNHQKEKSIVCKIDMHGEISYEIIRELTDRREQLEKTKRVREAF